MDSEKVCWAICGAMYYAAMVTGWQRHSALKMPQYEKKMFPQ